MSRSYREPVFVDGYGTRRKRYAKNLANRYIRRTKDIPNGNAYRKYYDSWDICDYRFRWDPYPHIRCWKFGEAVVVEPIPEWKARRK